MLIPAFPENFKRLESERNDLIKALNADVTCSLMKKGEGILPRKVICRFRRRLNELDAQRRQLIEVCMNRFDCCEEEAIKFLQGVSVSTFSTGQAKYICPASTPSDDILTQKDARIDELEEQLQEANNRIMESEKKTNPGCEAASEKRLQQWKDVYFPAIHAVARQCEEEGPKEGKERRQRKDIRAMLEAYLPGMEVPNAVVNYTFSFLDDSLVDRTGGNT